MIDRRTFIASTIGLAATAIYSKADGIKEPGVKKKKVRIYATKWGNDQPLDEFCRRIKESGYDGLENLLPETEKEQEEYVNACNKHGLEYAFLILERGKSIDNHLAYFKKTLSGVTKHKPSFINCHSGRDIFTFEQNMRVIDALNAISKETNVPIYHETHRQHMLFAGPVSKQYLDQNKDFKITLDISHWCTVHESYLEDQEEIVDAALNRTGHIHARVGHPQGPQVGDPRAPEWKRALEKHLSWWDKAVANNQRNTNSPLTITTEFGPFDYMPSIPYSRKAVADQFEVNVHMLNILKERYA